MTANININTCTGIDMNLEKIRRRWYVLENISEVCCSGSQIPKMCRFPASPRKFAIVKSLLKSKQGMKRNSTQKIIFL